MLITEIFIVSVVLVVIGYDIMAERLWGAKGTESYVVWKLVKNFPGVACGLCLVIGFILGHLFWQCQSAWSIP